MTVVAPAAAGVGLAAAKMKFFQRRDPYVKYFASKKRGVDGAPLNLNQPSVASACTVYGSAFSPPFRGKRFFVACTSEGCVAVWDVRPHSSSRDDGVTRPGSLAPLFSVRVGGESGPNSRVLYDLQFIEEDNTPLLVVSGDPGVVVYRWSDFEAAIDANSDGGTSVVMTPVATFQPHPSPATSYGELVEINSTAYSPSDGVLYGAAGDAFGCYQWDLASEKLLGTFGSGHRDYLHVVQTIPKHEGAGTRYVVTGGEDGNMGFWDGKERKLVEMIDLKVAMDKNKGLVTSNATSNSRSFGNTSTWSSGSNLWVSSMDMNGDWLAVGGGAETSGNSLGSRQGSGTSGFLTLWHLPTRTFTSGCVTRESVNSVVYNSPIDSLVSGGNEGRISLWEATTLARKGRAWSTPSATYTMSVDPESSIMVVGGSGGTLDCFVDRVKISQLHV
ncbi:hypothetical protein ACHAXT_011569 [Thalassiosira profunda]